MKTVYFIRHGELDESRKIGKFQMELSQKGMKDISNAAKMLLHREVHPSLLITSTSKACIASADIFNRVFVDYNRGILHSTNPENTTRIGIIEALASANDNCRTIFFFGHNPALYKVVHQYTQTKHDDIPVGGIVGVQFSIMGWVGLLQRHVEAEEIFFSDPDFAAQEAEKIPEEDFEA